MKYQTSRNFKITMALVSIAGYLTNEVRRTRCRSPNSSCKHSEEAVLLCINHNNETANQNTTLPGTARTVAESVNRAIKY